MPYLTHRLTHAEIHVFSSTRAGLSRKPGWPAASTRQPVGRGNAYHATRSRRAALASSEPPGNLPRRGTSLVFPTKFVPPSPRSLPTRIFEPYRTNNGITRWARTGANNDRQLLIYADGACPGNGLPGPRAGWAFVTGPLFKGQASPRIISGRLEKKGPFGDVTKQTNNRAELRAVLAALRYRCWADEGFNTVVVATDSKLVVEGSTAWAIRWFVRDWRKESRSEPVKNRDLWEALLGEVEKLYRDDVKIQLWSIPRRLNRVADAAAKKAAEGDDVGEYTDVFAMQ